MRPNVSRSHPRPLPTMAAARPLVGAAAAWRAEPVTPTLLSLLTALALLALSTLFAPSAAAAQSLRGSMGSMMRQNEAARHHQFTFLSSRGQVLQFVDQGYLVPISGNADFRLKEVSFPYARPEVKVFIERLAAQYRSACGEQLVVTSLTRPKSHQPPNASRISVHPTGMALDLRRTWNRACRRWIEGVLLTLEDRGVLEATYERWPPHYHVALFPRPYAAYLEQLAARPGEEEFQVTSYRVSPGDTLWKIANRHRTTVEEVKRGNGLRSNRIYPGQVLKVPSGR